MKTDGEKKKRWKRRGDYERLGGEVGSEGRRQSKVFEKGWG